MMCTRSYCCGSVQAGCDGQLVEDVRAEVARLQAALTEAEAEQAVLVSVLDEIAWPLIGEPACAGRTIRSKTREELTRMAADAVEGHLPRITISPKMVEKARKLLRERDGYKALAGLHKEELKQAAHAFHATHRGSADNLRFDTCKWTVCIDAHTAIAMTPADALKREEKR